MIRPPLYAIGRGLTFDRVEGYGAILFNQPSAISSSWIRGVNKFKTLWIELILLVYGIRLQLWRRWPVDCKTSSKFLA